MKTMRMIMSLFFSLFLCKGFGEEQEKILIFTYSYNKPQYIETQYRTFQKFLKDDYEFIVFSDAVDPLIQEEIKRVCGQLGLRCVEIPQEIHTEGHKWGTQFGNNPSVRNSNVVLYSLLKMGFAYEGIVALFDSDLFLVRDFSIRNFMQDYSIAGVAQSRHSRRKRVDYLWIGLVFLDMRKLPDRETLRFNTGVIDGLSVDAGGYTAKYLRAHPGVPVRYFSAINFPFFPCQSCIRKKQKVCLHNEKDLQAWGFDEAQVEMIQEGILHCDFFENGSFFHYRAGSNWDKKSEGFHRTKENLMNRYMERILAE